MRPIATTSGGIMIGTDKAVSSGYANRLFHWDSTIAVIVPVMVERIATGPAIARLLKSALQNSGESMSMAYQFSVKPLMGKLTIAPALNEKRTTRISGPNMKTAKRASTKAHVKCGARVIAWSSGRAWRPRQEP